MKNKHTPEPIPLKDRDLKDLFCLVFELHGRAVSQWTNEKMHKAYDAARQELWSRIKCLSGIEDPEKWVSDHKEGKEAQKFAEWCGANGFEFCLDKHWRFISKIVDSNKYTTAELYTKFKE